MLRNHFLKALAALALTLLALAPLASNPAPAEAAGNAVPTVTLDGPGTAFIGDTYTFTVTFDNTGPAADDVGYGPFIDLYLPDTDGGDGDGGFANPESITITYLGTPITPVFNDTISGTVDHPFARQFSSGNRYQVTGNPGDRLVVFRLPFGSFTQEQPPAEIEISINTNSDSYTDTDWEIRARGGFEFGSLTPLDDWCCTEGALLTPNTPSPTTWTGPLTVTPIVFEVSKSNDAPESESATGPNHPFTYTIDIDLADGQSVNNLVVTDNLPDNLIFVSSSPAPSSPASPGSTPGEELTFDLGTVNSDQIIEIQVYAPRLDAASNDVLNPGNGNPVDADNTVSAIASWTPSDTGDPSPVPVSGVCAPPCEGGTVTLKSLAVQKSVSDPPFDDNNAAGYTPGDIVEYTINFQVSDYFVFDRLQISDVLGDGQTFLTAGPYAPTLELASEDGTLSAAAFDAANFSPNSAPPHTRNGAGATAITFEISNEMITRGFGSGGILRGGCVDETDADGYLDACDGTPNAGATGRIVFYAEIDELFVVTPASGDVSVDHNDVLTNDITITGRRLDVTDFSNTGPTVTDDSGTTYVIVGGTLTKSIYAVNGSTIVPNPLTLSPTDTITYRLIYTLPSSDTDGIVIDDYLPLPVLDADELDTPHPASCDGDGFDETITLAIPEAGCATYGPTDTYRTVTTAAGTPAAGIPAVSVDSNANRVSFTYVDFDPTSPAPPTQPSQIDLLFTVTASDEPFADGLRLTNQARVTESNSENSATTADAIIQFRLGQPVLVGTKSVLGVYEEDGTTDPNAVFTGPAAGNAGWRGSITTPAAQSAPGAQRWGTANSFGGTDYNPGTPPARNAINQNAGVVEPLDIVTFGLIVQNVGGSSEGAFDIIIRDLYDTTRYQQPTGAGTQGYNIRASFADGTEVTFESADGATPLTTQADIAEAFFDLADRSDTTFRGGLRLVDPLSPSEGICQSHLLDPARGTIIITYDLQVRPGVGPGEVIENTGEILDYAGAEGATSHIPGDRNNPDDDTIIDDATVTILSVPGKAGDPGLISIGETYRQTIDIVIPAQTNARARFDTQIDADSDPDSIRLIDTIERNTGFQVEFADMGTVLPVNGSQTSGNGSTTLIQSSVQNCPFSSSIAAYAAGIEVSTRPQGNDIEVIWDMLPIDNSASLTDCRFTLEIDVRITDLEDPTDPSSARDWLPVASAFTLRDEAALLYRDQSNNNQRYDAGNFTVTIGQPVISLQKGITDIFGPGGSSTLPQPVRRGDTVQYRFTLQNLVSNGAGAEAHDVTVEDILPEHTAYVAGSTRIYCGLPTGASYAAASPVADPAISTLGAQQLLDFDVSTEMGSICTNTFIELDDDVQNGTDDPEGDGLGVDDDRIESVFVFFNVVVLDTMPVDESGTAQLKYNDADADWSSAAGSAPTERLYDDRYDDDTVFGGSVGLFDEEDGPDNGTNEDAARAAFRMTGALFSKEFLPNPIPVNGTSTLTFTIVNNAQDQSGAAIPLNNVAFTDPLPAEVFIAAVPNVTQSLDCTGGVITALPGGTNISVSGLSIPAGATCTITVDVTSAINDVYDNTTSPLTATEIGTGNTAFDSLVVSDRLGMYKRFAPSPLNPGEVATLTFRLVNADPTRTMLEVEFFEFLPPNQLGEGSGQVEVAPVPNATYTGCGAGAFVGLDPGDIDLTFANGTILPFTTCTVTVDVVASSDTTYTNQVDPSLNSTGITRVGDLPADRSGLPRNTFIFNARFDGETDRFNGDISNVAPLVVRAEDDDDDDDDEEVPLIPGLIDRVFSMLTGEGGAAQDQQDAALPGTLPSTGGGAPPIGGLVIGAVALLSVAAGAAALLRRRQAR